MQHTISLTIFLAIISLSTMGIHATANHLGIPHGWTVASRKIKYFISQCRANGGTVVASSYGSDVVACRTRSGVIRYCHAINPTQIQCWSNQTQPPSRPTSPASNSDAADPGSGGGLGQPRPAPEGPKKPTGGCAGGVC